MTMWLTRIGTIAAVAMVILSFVNASWIAKPPPGVLKLVAHRGVCQSFNWKGVGSDTCTATTIAPPTHRYLENTIASIRRAFLTNANVVEIDVQATADGQLVLFHDATLECRTNGTGPVSAKTLAELQQLDIGYGYTADSGKTHPFRGAGTGLMPTLEEAVRQFPNMHFMINFKNNDAADADLVIATFARIGRPIDRKYSFYGSGANPVGRMREKVPGVWGWTTDEVKACSADYFKTGWLGITPESCRNRTITVPLNSQWLTWGWPNRFMQRMHAANVKVILTGPAPSGGASVGLERVEQIPDVPRDFNGYLWVEDIATIGPAIR